MYTSSELRVPDPFRQPGPHKRGRKGPTAQPSRNDLPPEVVQAKRDSDRRTGLMRQYGMTIRDFEDLEIRQGGLCAICGGTNKDRRLHVDHDHKTGIIRGLLCFNCNTGLGKFVDDPALLRAATKYLEESM